MKYVNTQNWSEKDHEWLLKNIGKKSIEDIAEKLGRTSRAVRLYCYRHHIPIRQVVKRPMMQQLLNVKFGDWRYFRPTRDFYRRVGITQMRWNDLAWGYAQASEKELRNTANALNFSEEDAFKLMEARQGFLFDDTQFEEYATDSTTND